MPRPPSRIAFAFFSIQVLVCYLVVESERLRLGIFVCENSKTLLARHRKLVSQHVTNLGKEYGWWNVEFSKKNFRPSIPSNVHVVHPEIRRKQKCARPMEYALLPSFFFLFFFFFADSRVRKTLQLVCWRMFIPPCIFSMTKAHKPTENNKSKSPAWKKPENKWRVPLSYSVNLYERLSLESRQE